MPKPSFHHRLFLALAGVGVAFAATAPAAAQLELSGALRKLEHRGIYQLPRAVRQAGGERIPILAEYPADSELSELLVGGRYRPLWLTPDELSRLTGEQPDLKLHWAPPRRPLLDQADNWIGVDGFHEATGFTGQGVVIGIVDTGLDVGHGDLRDEDGKSRVRYLIDFSRPPGERQAELEDEYGCTSDTECAIFSNEDLDALLNNAIDGDEPRDTYGHGTHVASLAAGNGLAAEGARYTGVAPGATLFGARVSRGSGGAIFDADIILATRFIFEQAERLGLPAIVNLSLGGDFGTHDGSSPLEQGLASFVGPDFPGRAIVVAAGNSGNIYTGTDSGEPEPLGIHTEVHVPRESTAEIPIITPSEALGGTLGATIYVWLGFQSGDEISVAVDHDGDPWVPAIAPGEASTYSAEGYEGTVFNGPTREGSGITVGDNNAVVVIDGDFRPGTRFTLRLSGHGTVNLWLQSGGGASPDVSTGALFPRGEKQGTINIPAAHADLIAVGATVNRNRWRDENGEAFLIGRDDGSANLAEIDGTAPFSAAGPNALGVIKPDLVAPGMYVIGAMSGDADPRQNGGLGVFASNGRCAEPDYECFVIEDDVHAITSGTSMSAPLVSGAVALLLEQRPELTQPQIRTLLQAGARQPTGTILAEQQLGPGMLDLRGTLAALQAEDSPIERTPADQSRIVLAASFIRPDPKLPLNGLLQLRDSSDNVADVSDPRRLGLEVSGGSLSMAPTRLGPGLFSFQVAAPEGSGGGKLGIRLMFDGAPLASRSVPIGVDRWLAEGDPLARGGCSVASARAARLRSWPSLLALMLLLPLWQRRRASTKRGS
jgi:subtilisin family serine protease